MKQMAVIFDLDGTAINSPSQKIPTERLVNAIRAIEEKYYVCAATGRVWSFAEPILKGMGLSDICIISGGTQICDPKTGEILWQMNIESTDAEVVVKVLKQFPEYKTLHNEYTEEDYLHGGTPPKELEINEPTYFLEQTFIPETIAPEIIARLSEIKGVAATQVVAMRDGCKDIHITNRNATKEHAIAELLAMLGIEKAKTIGIGDGHNDMHLFSAVEHKVAMGNAVDELKDAANEVIGTVTDDGLAEYLETLIS